MDSNIIPNDFIDDRFMVCFFKLKATDVPSRKGLFIASS